MVNRSGSYAILIAGPTAGGKSRLALDLAAQTGGIIANADSMQVYDGLRVLTARPDAADEAAAEHRLYGHVAPDVTWSTGQWLREAERLAGDAGRAGRPVIFVGGTGLYFNALTRGIASVPEIDPEIRRQVRDLARNAPDDLHARAAGLDPEGLARLDAGDVQRTARLVEVVWSTGRTLAQWQTETPGAPVIDLDAPGTRALLVAPDRDERRRRIATRFDLMTRGGVEDEVRAFLALGIAPDRPLMKAIGVAEFAGLFAGKLTREQVREAVIVRTQQYAKRQMTWFRNQFGAHWRRVGS